MIKGQLELAQEHRDLAQAINRSMPQSTMREAFRMEGSAQALDTP
nr:hypothetical protein [Pseudomonas sp. TH31]